MLKRLIFLMLIVEMIILNYFRDIVLAEDKDYITRLIELPLIIITPSRVERRISEVAYSINVISEKEIEGSNAKSVPDLLKDLEGIYMYDASGVGTAGRINMRGFWGGMSTHQLVLVDGIPQNAGRDKLVDWNLIPLDDIERIEIVRGPVSCLYGDNAMSGVINIITKRPSEVPETKIYTSYGSYNTQNYKISTSGAFKGVGYYLGASRKSTDGFRKFCGVETIHFNGKLDFLVAETQDLKLSLDYHREERGAHPWALTETEIETNRRQARPGTEEDESEVNKCNLGINYRGDIGKFINLEGTFYYRYEDSESFYTGRSTRSSTQEQLTDEDTFGLFLRLNTNSEIFKGKHSFTIGVDLEKNLVNYQEYSAPYQIRGDIRQDYEVDRDKIGPYIQDEIMLFESLKLTAGIRYDLVRFDFTDHRNESNSTDEKMFKISPKCGLVYVYGKDSNLYASYSRAFRTPTIGQLFTYGSFSNPDLDPEEATNYELGIHHRFNDCLKANVSLYWMDMDNEIQYDYAASRYENIGETFRMGTETSLDFMVTERLTGFINYAYTRATNKSGEYDGNYLTNIPIHKGSLGIDCMSDYGLKVGLIGRMVGSSYIDSANDDKLRTYMTVDSRISYENKGASVFLGIDNLLDKEYSSYGFKSGRTRKFNPASGRTYTFGAELQF